MTFDEFVRALQFHNHFRLPYVRKYPPNSIWRGHLSSVAINELEMAGNTIRRDGDHYILNSTAPAHHIKAELIGTIESTEGVL